MDAKEQFYVCFMIKACIGILYFLHRKNFIDRVGVFQWLARLARLARMARTFGSLARTLAPLIRALGLF